MLWLILTILSAFSQSTSDLFSKKGLQHLNEYVVAFSRNFIAVLCLIPLLLLGIPQLDLTFWIVTLFWSFLNALSTILYMKAIKMSPLSLTIPMLAFSPLFMLVTSPLIIGEFPSFVGLIGIFLIVFGAYTLSIKDIKRGYLAPFKALLSEKGAILMLGVAFIFSVGTNFSKIAVQHSNPFFYGVVSTTFSTILLFLILLLKSKDIVREVQTNLTTLFPIGLFDALRFILTLIALEFTIVPYVVSIKRTTILFSTLYGYFFFKEKRIIERLSGTLIMILGIIIISIF